MLHAKVLLTKATASPAAHKRMIGKYLLDEFGGPGFLTQASNHFGLRGGVLDTKFGPRYDVTKLLVYTRIRQEVSAGTCVAGMTSPLSCSSEVMSASAAIANLFHRARMPILELGMRVTDLALTCGSELIARTDLPMRVTLATHDGHSLKIYDDSILHIQHVCRIVSSQHEYVVICCRFLVANDARQGCHGKLLEDWESGMCRPV